MKTLKIILISILTLFTIVFANGCYYVFHGQYKSVEKLQQGEELNLYECCSIYSMHCAVWMFGWPLSPEAAKECFKLHFPQDEHVAIGASYKFHESLKLQEAYEYLKDKPLDTEVYVTWDGNEDYSIKSSEHRTAIAVNPCRVIKAMEHKSGNRYMACVEASMIYPKYSKTTFDCGKFKITLYEGLFRYLQDKGWLSTYKALYWHVIYY